MSPELDPVPSPASNHPKDLATESDMPASMPPRPYRMGAEVPLGGVEEYANAIDRAVTYLLEGQALSCKPIIDDKRVTITEGRVYKDTRTTGYAVRYPEGNVTLKRVEEKTKVGENYCGDGRLSFMVILEGFGTLTFDDRQAKAARCSRAGQPIFDRRALELYGRAIKLFGPIGEDKK